ncbi:hypothetical protein Tco_1151226, partial [Tanacetum coccineum]
VCRLAGRGLRVAVYRSLKTCAIAVCGIAETLAEGNEYALHLGPEIARVYSDLSPEDKERYTADIRATNILLQGLPKDIYTLINHYTNAKDIWDNVKMLLEGSELTKEDRESQLMQLNSKFVNNMLPEQGRFVTVVKLNRGLRDSNYDQLNQAIVQDGRVVVQNVQGRHNRGQGNNARGTGATGYEGAQNRVGNANLEYFKDKMLQMQAQENGVALDEEQLMFITADDCDAFDFDVDEAPTTQTMFMANLSSADPVYDEASPSYDLDISIRVIGYKNLFYMSKAKQVQHALYSFQEIVKPNHARVLVHDSEDTLEIAETTRKANELKKMKDLEYVKKKVKIARYDYSKENYLATFTPRKHLTPEQIFWSKDLLKMKEEEHFEGIQKALTKEIKEMKEIFEELEAEVDQNVVNRKYDGIERKNLLIANDNLIADCFSKEVFYIATNSELTVSRFTEMHDAHTVVQACCLELEAELSKLRDKVQKDDLTKLVKCFSNLEVNHLNL